MPIKIDPSTLIGVRYGRLVARELFSTEQRFVKGQKLGYKYHFLWQCDCGKEKVIELRNVTDGSSRSCGCLNAEMIVERSLKHGKAKRYGTKRTPEYKAWIAMNDRCYCKTSSGYQFYGAVGISVADEWRGEDGFENFLRDMGTKPTPKHSLDRIDNNLGYSKVNCRWANWVEQANNKTNNVILVYKEERYTLPNLIRHLGIDMARYGTLHNRYRKGWSVERIFHEYI